MFADRAFGDGVIWGHISQVQSGEGEGLATHRQGEMVQTPPQVAPHSGLILPPSILPPRSALNRLKNSTDRKGRKLQVGILSSHPPGGGVAGPLLKQGELSGHLGKRQGLEWRGRELRPHLHHHLAQFKPCDIFLPSPCRPSGYQHLPSPSIQEHRLRCQLLGIKGVCLYSKRAVAHSESAHAKAEHVTAPPAQSPSGTDANLWLETFLNMSLAQRVRFPGLLCPEIPSQEF